MGSRSSCAGMNCHKPSFISSVSKRERATHQTRWWSLHLLSGCSDIQRQEQRMSSGKKRRCCCWFLYLWLIYLEPVPTFKFAFKMFYGSLNSSSCVGGPINCFNGLNLCIKLEENITFIPKIVNKMKTVFWNQCSLTLQYKMWNTAPIIGDGLAVF